jgi:hypothetical protein
VYESENESENESESASESTSENANVEQYKCKNRGTV